MNRISQTKNRAFVLSGLGIALLVGVFVSPFASKNPDGLNRVSQDQGFEKKAAEEPVAKKLPFAQVFNQYALRGAPERVATPIAGLVGTLVTFGLAWGAGKVLVKHRRNVQDNE